MKSANFVETGNVKNAAKHFRTAEFNAAFAKPLTAETNKDANNNFDDVMIAEK
jgi:hypothetical protein